MGIKQSGDGIEFDINFKAIIEENFDEVIAKGAKLESQFDDIADSAKSVNSAIKSIPDKISINTSQAKKSLQDLQNFATRIQKSVSHRVNNSQVFDMVKQLKAAGVHDDELNAMFENMSIKVDGVVHKGLENMLAAYEQGGKQISKIKFNAPSMNYSTEYIESATKKYGQCIEDLASYSRQLDEAMSEDKGFSAITNLKQKADAVKSEMKDLSGIIKNNNSLIESGAKVLREYQSITTRLDNAKINTQVSNVPKLEEQPTVTPTSQPTITKDQSQTWVDLKKNVDATNQSIQQTTDSVTKLERTLKSLDDDKPLQHLDLFNLKKQPVNQKYFKMLKEAVEDENQESNSAFNDDVGAVATWVKRSKDKILRTFNVHSDASFSEYYDTGQSPFLDIYKDVKASARENIQGYIQNYTLKLLNENQLMHRSEAEAEAIRKVWNNGIVSITDLTKSAVSKLFTDFQYGQYSDGYWSYDTHSGDNYPYASTDNRIGATNSEYYREYQQRALALYSNDSRGNNEYLSDEDIQRYEMLVSDVELLNSELNREQQILSEIKTISQEISLTFDKKPDYSATFSSDESRNLSELLKTYNEEARLIEKRISLYERLSQLRTEYDNLSIPSLEKYDLNNRDNLVLDSYQKARPVGKLDIPSAIANEQSQLQFYQDKSLEIKQKIQTEQEKAKAAQKAAEAEKAETQAIEQETKSRQSNIQAIEAERKARLKELVNKEVLNKKDHAEIASLLPDNKIKVLQGILDRTFALTSDGHFDQVKVSNSDKGRYFEVSGMRSKASYFIDNEGNVINKPRGLQTTIDKMSTETYQLEDMRDAVVRRSAEIKAAEQLTQATSQEADAHKRNAQSIEEEALAHRENKMSLQDKIERLEDIANQYGTKISQKDRNRYEQLGFLDSNRYEGLTDKEYDRYSELGDTIAQADSALRALEEDYDRIILKLEGGAKVEITIDDSGLNKLEKIANEYFSGEYNGKQIEDVNFVNSVVKSHMSRLSPEYKLDDKSGNKAIVANDTITVEIVVNQEDGDKNRLQEREEPIERILSAWSKKSGKSFDAFSSADETSWLLSFNSEQEYKEFAKFWDSSKKELSTVGQLSSEIQDSTNKLNENADAAKKAAEAHKELEQAQNGKYSKDNLKRTSGKYRVKTGVLPKQAANKAVKSISQEQPSSQQKTTPTKSTGNTANDNIKAFRDAFNLSAKHGEKDIRGLFKQLRDANKENNIEKYNQAMDELCQLVKQRTKTIEMENEAYTQADNYVSQYTSRIRNSKNPAVYVNSGFMSELNGNTGDKYSSQSVLSTVFGAGNWTTKEESGSIGIDAVMGELASNISTTGNGVVEALLYLYEALSSPTISTDIVEDIRSSGQSLKEAVSSVVNGLLNLNNFKPQSTTSLGVTDLDLSDAVILSDGNQQLQWRLDTTNEENQALEQQLALEQSITAEQEKQAKLSEKTKSDKSKNKPINTTALTDVEQEIIENIYNRLRSESRELKSVNADILNLQYSPSDTPSYQEHMDKLVAKQQDTNNNISNLLDQFTQLVKGKYSKGKIDIQSFADNILPTIGDKNYAKIFADFLNNADVQNLIGKDKLNELSGIFRGIEGANLKDVSKSNAQANKELQEQNKQALKLEQERLKQEEESRKQLISSKASDFKAALQPFVDIINDLYEVLGRTKRINAELTKRQGEKDPNQLNSQYIKDLISESNRAKSDLSNVVARIENLLGPNYEQGKMQVVNPLSSILTSQELGTLTRFLNDNKTQYVLEEKGINQLVEALIGVQKVEADKNSKQTQLEIKRQEAARKEQEKVDKQHEKETQHISPKQFSSNSIEEAIKMLNSANPNSTTLFDFGKVLNQDQMMSEMTGFIDNMVEQANLRLANIKLDGNKIFATLKDDNLKATINQVYSAFAPDANHENAYFTLKSTYSQKYLAQDTFDVEGTIAKANSQIDKLRSSTHGLIYDFSELSKAASSIKAPEDFVKFGLQLATVQNDIQSIRNQIVSTSSMNPFANMFRDINNAESIINELDLGLKRLAMNKGGNQYIQEAYQLIDTMKSAKKEFDEATTTEGQVKAYNTFSNSRSQIGYKEGEIKKSQQLVGAYQKQIDAIKKSINQLGDVPEVDYLNSELKKLEGTLDAISNNKGVTKNIEVFNQRANKINDITTNLQSTRNTKPVVDTVDETQKINKLQASIQAAKDKMAEFQKEFDSLGNVSGLENVEAQIKQINDSLTNVNQNSVKDMQKVLDDFNNFKKVYDSGKSKNNKINSLDNQYNNEIKKIHDLGPEIEHAESVLEDFRQKLVNLGNIDGVDKVSSAFNKMEESIGKAKNATSSSGIKDALKDFYNAQTAFKDAEKAMSQGGKSYQGLNINQTYDSLLSIVNKINAVNQDIIKFQNKDNGTGVITPHINKLKADRSQLESELQAIMQDLNNFYNNQTVFQQGSKNIVPEMSSLLQAENYSGVRNFLNDIQTQSVLADSEFEKLLNSFKKAQEVDLSIGNNFDKMFEPMQNVYTKLSAFPNLNESTLAPLKQVYQRISEIKAGLQNGSILWDDSSKISELKKLISIYEEVGNKAVQAAQKEQQFFAGMQKNTIQMSTPDGFKDYTFAAEKLDDVLKGTTSSSNYNIYRQKLEEQAKAFVQASRNVMKNGKLQADFGEMFITGFQSKGGISTLDFQVFDKAAGSLRNFQMAMGTTTDDVYRLETTVNKSFSSIQAAEKQISTIGQTLKVLDASNVNINPDTATAQVQKLYSIMEALNKEMAKGDSADQNVLAKLTQDAKMAVNEVNKAYQQMHKVQQMIDSGSANGFTGKQLDINNIRNSATQSIKEYAQQYGYASIENIKFDNSNRQVTASLIAENGEITKLTGSIDQINGKMALAAQSTGKMQQSAAQSAKAFGQFKTAIASTGKQLLTAVVGYNMFFKVISEIRNGISQVKEIDLAMTELKKVTDESAKSYDNLMKTAYTSSSKIGATMTDFINATANFSRLGYNMTNASDMAQTAIVYKNVAEGVDSIDDASQSIISTMKAFNIASTDTMTIADKFNEVGNNYAITSAGIGDALTRSASALAAGGNTIDESIALITGANSVVQDPDVVGKNVADIKGNYIG